ncbi:GNAT family N-acetyltransferase [Nocardioides sp.]|uniref:GNAT family N-acetyltransferase n=1 Tax=Nocardioides sp. TaxID=35761 RepID=UPI0027374065|nr:GNAT family N-acetyltransferase [Nocardioides sp.]MDP3892752.1 GNAT family N-acetyltransferase [Nocardioides sp.]
MTTHPASAVSLRELARTDLPALATLLQQIEDVDQTDEHVSLADLEEEHADPLREPADWIGAFAGSDLVGYAQVVPRTPAEGTLKMYSGGGVHPDHRGRGVGTLLVEAMVARMEERHRTRRPDLTGIFVAAGLTENDAQRALLERVGLVPDRYTLVLAVDPLPPTEVGDLPEGLRIRTYDPAADEGAMRVAHNAAFTGHHPNFTPWDEELWRQWVTGSRNFRADLSFLVVDDDGAIAAYVQTNEYDAVQQATGRREAFIAKVGTTPERRGRGLASTLLRHTLEACRRDGMDRACLDVDSENPSGALGVYERAGFVLERRWTDYLRTEPPVTSAS